MVKPIKIVIDARMYGLEHAGIGRYVSNLVREIVKDTSGVSSTSEVGVCTPRRWRETTEFYFLVRKSKFNEIKKEVGDKFKIVVVDAPHYSFKEQLIVPIQLFKLKPNLVHFPHFNVPVFWWGKQVVTIHDLIKHESRGTETTTRWRVFYWFKYLNYQLLIWLAIKRAAKIIVPSEWWKKELVKRYKLPRNKVVVTYEGVDKKFKVPQTRTSSIRGRHCSKLKVGKQQEKILNKYAIRKPFIIYTGSLYPHKNVERLVKAIRLVNNTEFILAKRTKDTSEVEGKEKVSLVIACSRNVFYERFKKKVRKMRAEKFVNLVGFVPDEDLVVLYRQAEAFVFPSLLEGFGLPGLEAMACGCPVVASNIPVLREIYGKAALYFNPYDINDITQAIKEVTYHTILYDMLRRKGLKQAKKYSWQKMARETLTVYFSVLS